VSENAGPTEVDMKKLTFEIIIILAISLVAGFISNSVSSSRIAWVGHWPSLSDSEDDSTWDCLSCEPGDPPFLNLVEASALHQNLEVVFLDARYTEEYERGHIEDALLLPFEAEEDVYDAHWKKIEPLLDTNTLIVTYCSGTECESSLFLARYLRDEMGYDSVKIFFGGWRRWEKAGLPVVYPDREQEG
jgi:rhodanese-related sulfurtransferase